jgi:hypothetical protein
MFQEVLVASIIRTYHPEPEAIVEIILLLIYYLRFCAGEGKKNDSELNCSKLPKCNVLLLLLQFKD